MYFQILDSKRECPSVFVDDKIIDKKDASSLTHTWAYHLLLDPKVVKFAQILLNGMHLEDACPLHLKTDLNALNKQYKCYEKAFKNSKIDLAEHCIVDLFPEAFVIKYNNLKNEITKYVFENYSFPENYDFLVSISSLVEEIALQKLNIDYSFFNNIEDNNKTINLKKKIKKINPVIKYNAFGTVTGRLTTKKDSFPILTLDKKYRSILKPNNDFFVEFDYNAADPRTFLFLNNIPQPRIDIHDWHRQLYEKNFNQSISRDQIKVKFMAWLYNDSDFKFKIPEIDDYYNEDSILNKYYNDNVVKTVFGRNIPVEPKKALPILIQSTCCDIFLTNVLKVRDIIGSGKHKSYISILIHDNMVLDFSKEDLKLLKPIILNFSKVFNDKWLVNIKIGKDLGNMKSVNVKSL